MKKASKYLVLIGNSFEIVFAIFLIFFVVMSFIISSPGYSKIIQDGITSGRITPMGGATLAEQVAIIQRSFVFIGIITIFFTLISIAAVIFTFLAIREEEKRTYVITALVLSIISFNILLIVGHVFKIVGKDE